MNYKILIFTVSILMSNYASSDTGTPKDNDFKVPLPGACCLLFTGKTVEREWYESGNLKSTAYFDKGVLDGVVTGYYKNGSIKTKGFYRNGKREGRTVFYYPNGSKQVEQHFSDDILNGDHRVWYDTGGLMKLVPYSMGLVNGNVKTYYETGEIFENVEFEYGTPKTLITYMKDGSIAKQDEN